MTKREPDYQQFLKALHGEAPDRPVQYEHYCEPPHLDPVLGQDCWDDDHPSWGWMRNSALSYARLGYDVCGLKLHFGGSQAMVFQAAHKIKPGASIGQWEGAGIQNEADLSSYPWPDPEKDDYPLILDELAKALPKGMRVLLRAPIGIYEALVELLGFEQLCIALVDNPALVSMAVECVQAPINRYFERILDHPLICGIQVCDDWGHKTGTMISPAHLREFVFPAHQRWVRLAHEAGKIAMLHSCGKVDAVMDDVIENLRYDAKHSFEDVITPPEEAWKRWGQRIAIIGGIDVDFLSRATPERVAERSRNLIQETRCRRYVLGSGNSITAAMPVENIAAMRRVAWGELV